LFEQEFNDPTAGGDFDNDGPNVGDYAGDAAYYAKEGASAAKSGIKKILPIIVVAIIAIVIIGFVFSWLGAQQTINFTVKELDGKTISGARLIIKDSSGNTLLNKSGSIHSLTLAPGTYSIKVTSMEHDSFEDSLTTPQVDDGGTRNDSFTISMPKSLEGALIIDLQETKIYEKQTISGEIKIENTGDDDMIDEEILIDTGTSSNLKNDINFSPTRFTVSSGGSTLISFSMTLNTDISSIEVDESIKFRIAGTQIKDDVKITLMPAVSEKDIDIKGDVKTNSIREDDLTSGDQKDIRIQIENDNKTIPLENIKLTIEAESGYESKLSWFEFDNYGTQKYETTLGSVSPQGKESITLQITPAIDAEEGDQFKGTIRIESLSIEEREIPIDILLIVENQKRATLTFDVSPLATDCYTSGAPCKIIPTLGKINIENTGDVAVGPITIGFDETSGSDPNCELWIEFNATTISKLDIDEKKILSFSLNIPDGETTPYTICYLKAAYTDPLTSETNVDTSTPFQIKITVEDEP